MDGVQIALILMVGAVGLALAVPTIAIAFDLRAGRGQLFDVLCRLVDAVESLARERQHEAVRGAAAAWGRSPPEAAKEVTRNSDAPPAPEAQLHPELLDDLRRRYQATQPGPPSHEPVPRLGEDEDERRESGTRTKGEGR